MVTMNPDLSTYKVEKNVPLPRHNKGGYFAPLVNEMEVGDSVVIPTIELARRLRVSISNRGFSASVSRQVDGSFRVWKKAPLSK